MLKGNLKTTLMTQRLRKRSKMRNRPPRKQQTLAPKLKLARVRHLIAKNESRILRCMYAILEISREKLICSGWYSLPGLLEALSTALGRLWISSETKRSAEVVAL